MPRLISFLSLSLARVYWFGGNIHRPGSSEWPTQDEVFPRYCRDVSARLLFSMLAIYSLDPSSAAPLLLSIHLSIYQSMPHTHSLFHARIRLNLPGSLVAPVAAYLVRHGTK
jgi:hypothetical protein